MSHQDGDPGDGRLVNWDLAASTAAKLAPAGPKITGEEISAVVADLRRLADRAVPHVHEITGLAAAEDLRDSQVLIVDRSSWAKANTQSFAVMLASTLARLEVRAHRTESGRSSISPAGRRISGTVTGAELGAVLAFLSSKVLGQYDPFAAMLPGSQIPPAGRLLLVAPNIISVERELGVDPADFRLWVCLHEQTHRVQFAAAPWLRDHMLSEVDQLSGLLLGNMDNLGERVAAAIRSVSGRNGSSGSKDGEKEGNQDGVLELVQSPEEKAALSRLTALMSLLEGHANVVMDAVDESIVPTVRIIRQRFATRGKDRGVIERLLRNLMGLDAKMRQYSDGARFVRAVVDKAGMAGFNEIWAGPERLPTEAEIHDPQLWLDRMGW